MKPATRNLLILGVCIVALGGVLAALMLTGGTTEASTTASSSQDIALLNREEAEVASIEVTNTNGVFTIVPSEEQPEDSAAGTSSAVLSSESTESASAVSSESEPEIHFTIQELEGLPQDSYAVKTAAQGGWQLFATKKIGTVSNLTDFGLSTPQATVKVTFKNGDTYGYEIGNASVEDSTAYYVRGQTGEDIYVASVPMAYLQDKTGFLSRQVLDFSSLKADAAAPFRKLVLSGTAVAEPITLQQGEGTLYLMTEPKRMEADSETVTSLTDLLSYLTAGGVEALHPDADALREYGLENPANVVQMTTADGTEYTLKAGAEKDGNRMVMLDGVDIVYRIMDDSLIPWTSLTEPFDVQSKVLLTRNVEAVQTLSIELDSSETYRWNVTRTKDEEKSTDDTTYYNYTVADASGTTKDYTAFTNLYQVLTSETVLEDAGDTEPTGTPLFRAVVEYYDGALTNTLEFYSDGERNCVVVLDDVVRGSVPRGDIDTLQEALEGAVQ